MSERKLYIANMGLVCSLGMDVKSTVAAVNAGISAYGATRYENTSGEPVTMALIPEEIFSEIEIDIEIDEGDRYNERHDHITIMALIALNEACGKHETEKAIPLVMAMSEYQFDNEDLAPLIENLAASAEPWVDPALSRTIYSGRAAGIEAIEMAFDYLYDTEYKFILIGGSDSYLEDELLDKLDQKRRLLSASANDGFAPGEAAGFLLLTKHIELADVQDGYVIALNPPGVSEESGHMYSEEPYRGDGLDRAFKGALINHQHKNISSIYSSLNGENFWAKELGVAQLRNKKSFNDDVQVEHPVDCFGDLGAATAPVLVALAAQDLFDNKETKAHLVYSSSDSAKRGAIVVEKLPALAEQ